MARSRKPPTADELRARATARGYKRGTYKEKDKIRQKGIHNSTTIKNQDATLRRYVLWTLLELRDTAAQQGSAPPDEETAREHCLRPGIAAPDLTTVTDFMRFYAATSDPRLDEEISTVDSLNSVAEWFFAGFARVTKTEIVEEDRKEVYHFVRTTLVGEGLAVNRHRPKYNFTEESHTRLQGTLWTKDDLIFISERYRIQTTFIANVYCWTGARLSAFFTGGLRYRDTEIVLHRTEGARPWTASWRLDQRWVKNNRDPENIVYGSAHREHEKFIYNETGFLLVMAVADGALLGINSIDDLMKKRIPPGQNVLHLRYRASALEKPVLRRCTRDGGVTDDPMPKSTFQAIWRSNCSNADYYQIPTIHAVRRGLGIKVEKNYTPVQRSQHITQADLRVYGQSYLANCSSVDGQAAFLGERSDHRHIEYFQSIDQFWEPGLPRELPARVQDGLSRDPILCDLQEKVAMLERQGTTGPTVQEARRLVSNYRRTLPRKALRRFQKQWVSDRRDWKVLTDGREPPSDKTHTDLVQHLCLFIPERGRLARWMCQEEPLSPESMWQALGDLHTLCTRDLTVLYLPGLNPHEGRCPVKSCQKSMDGLPKNRRNHHIQTCTRDDMAKKLHQLPSHIHYCHLCFTWVVGEDGWESHCASHLASLTTKRCGTLSYGYTLVRPAYSPFRLGDTKLLAASRLQSWTRDFDLWTEVNEQLEGRRWPMPCPYPLCEVRLEDEHDLQFHFIDDHSFSRARPSRASSTNCSGPRGCDLPGNPRDQSLPPRRKRKAVSKGDPLQWKFIETAPPSVRHRSESDPSLPKKARVTSSTISPSLLSVVDLTGISSEDDTDTSLPPATGDLAMFHPHSVGAECDPLALRTQDRQPDDARSTAEPSTSSECADVFDGVFSPLKNSRSSSISSRSGSDAYCGERKALGQVWESTSSSDVLDSDSNFDTLFDQYIRPPSPSPSPAPAPAPSFPPPNDAASDLSGSTMVDGPPDPIRGSADSHPEQLGLSATEDMPERVCARDRGDTSRVVDGTRLRLRVSQPKIILRLKLPATTQAGMDKSKGGKSRNTMVKGTQWGKVKKGMKGTRMEKTKKGTKIGQAKKGTKSEKAKKGKKRKKGTI